MNEGTVAVTTGAILTLDGNWSNSGTLVCNGGELDLNGSFATAGIGKLQRNGGVVKVIGTLDNSNATLALNGGTGSWVLDFPGAIQGGHISLSGGASLQVPSYGALGAVSVDNDLVLADGAILQITGGLTVDGVLTMGGSGNGARLLFNDSSVQTLGGTGQVLFGGSASPNRIDVYSGGLTIAPGFVVRGGPGVVGSAGFPLNNQGTIASDAGAAISVLGNPVTNSGTLRADGAGAKITVQSTPFNNAGTIQELNGGKVIVNP
jgi:hypothetical protein